MSTDTVGKIKQIVKGEQGDLIDPYVEITFCGQKRRTTTEKSYELGWLKFFQFDKINDEENII